MASVIERLRDVLEEEASLYESLLGVSRKKTPAIVGQKLEDLNTLTGEEQKLVDKIAVLETKRESIMNRVAEILNTEAEGLKLDVLIRSLDKAPEQQKALAETADKLGGIVRQVRNVNFQNKELIDSALEMIQFEMNLLQASKSAPQTANYGRGAYSTGEVLGSGFSGFDAKQ